MILNFLKTKRSIENPAVPLTNEKILSYLSAGGGDTAGVTVNEQTALTYGAVYAAIRVLAESLACIPFHLYERDKEGNQKRLDSEPAEKLLNKKPNNYTTPVVFKEFLQAYTVSWGNGFARIERDGLGNPVSLYQIPSSSLDSVKRVQGKTVYKFKLKGGGHEEIQGDNILHIPGMGFNGLLGDSIIKDHARTIGIGIASEKFTSSMFEKGAWMSGYLTTKKSLSDKAYDRLVKTFSSGGGVANAGKPPLLEEETKYEQLKLPADDAAFLDLRRFQVQDVARIYRIPPHMLGDLERATFSNIESQSLSFVKETLAIWVTKWEQELSVKLIPERQQETRFFEANLDAILRGDSAARFQAYNTGIMTGWLTRAEARKKENLNTIEGLDKPFVPLNMGTVGEEIEADTAPAPDSDPSAERSTPDLKEIADGFCGVFGEVTERVAKFESDKVGKLVDSSGKIDPEHVKTYKNKRVQARVNLLAAPIADVCRVLCRVAGVNDKQGQIIKEMNEAAQRACEVEIGVLCGELQTGEIPVEEMNARFHQSMTDICETLLEGIVDKIRNEVSS